jgi:hypothetical protein
MIIIVNSTMGSALPSNAIPWIVAEWGIKSEYEEVLPISMFLIGYIFGEQNTTISVSLRLTDTLHDRATHVGPPQRTIRPPKSHARLLHGVYPRHPRLRSRSDMGWFLSPASPVRHVRQRADRDGHGNLCGYLRELSDTGTGYVSLYGSEYLLDALFNLLPTSLQSSGDLAVDE